MTPQTCIGENPAGRLAIDASAPVARSQTAVSCELSQEAVILDLASGVYFGLDSVGARIWQILEKPRSIHEIRDALLGEYKVDAAVCEQSVARFVNELLSKGLLEIA